MKHASIRSISEKLGISTATVSDVMNGKARAKRISTATEERVQKEAARQGYRPNLLAKSLVRRESKLLALMFQDFHYSLAEAVSVGAMDVLEAAGYRVVIGVSHWSTDREREELQAMFDHQVDGALVLPLQGNQEFFKGQRQPIVQILDWIDGLALPCVALDGEQAARDLVVHFHGLGHRRIGFLGVESRSPQLRMRHGGFLAACAGLGLSVSDGHIAFGTSANAESTYEAARGMLSQANAPTAIIGVGDAIALQIMEGLRGTRFEGKIALAGIGDLPNLGELLSLTSVSEPLEVIGRRAADLLLRRIAGETISPTPLLIRGKLKIRQSSLRAVPDPARS